MKCNNCKYFHYLELGKYCGAKGEYLENEDYSSCKGFKEKTYSSEDLELLQRHKKIAENFKNDNFLKK